MSQEKRVVQDLLIIENSSGAKEIDQDLENQPVGARM